MITLLKPERLTKYIHIQKQFFLIMSTDSSDNSKSDSKGYRLPEHADNSLITSITQTISQMSGDSRARRQRQKLREELVREHLQAAEQNPSSFPKSIILKLFG